MDDEHTDDLPDPASDSLRGRGTQGTASRWRIATIGLVVLALGFLGVGVAAAQEDDATDTSDAPAAEGDEQAPEEGEDEAPLSEEEREARREAFRACLEDQGIDVPEEGEERPDPSELSEEEREAFQAARDACAEFAPPHRGGCRPGGPGRPGEEGEGPPADAPAGPPADEDAS